MSDKPQLALDSFFPYQLTKLQAIVSDSIAQIYTGKFDLTRQEWRVLAILANCDAMTAKQIGDKANLEKMPASRAVNKMLQRNLISKQSNQDDKRSSLLSLTYDGKTLYLQLAQLVKARESEILSVLSSKEHELLQTMFAKLEIQATNTLKVK